MKFESQPGVYILTNKYNTVLYTGATSDLASRIEQHVGNPGFGFTGKYSIKKLVYIEACEDVEQAYLREKQIKGGSRQKKLNLINSLNPKWKDLSKEDLNSFSFARSPNANEGNEAISNLVTRVNTKGA